MALTQEAFAEQVKDALLHIYDLAYLPRLELTHLLAGAQGLTWEQRGQHARRALIEAIERLDPGPALPMRARERRSYALLSACFVRSMTAQAVMEELAISERQYWRDRKRAIEALADQLWEDCVRRAQEPANSSPTPTEQETVAREEADLLAAHSSPEPVKVIDVVRQAAGALQKVMEAKQAQLEMVSDDADLLAYADRTVLRQVCLNLLSHAFSAATQGQVSLQLQERPEAVEIAITTATQAGDRSCDERAHLGLQIVRRLVEAQGGYMEIPPGGADRWAVVVGLPKAQSLPILVVDDNAATIKLFQRYLAGSRYRVVAAESGARALELAGQVRPAAITLDVMMPGQDGWDTLQALRALPDLHGTPVIVCSILDEPQLAYSLGADGFMRKPVRQEALLQTLDRWLSHPREGASSRRAAPAGT